MKDWKFYTFITALVLVSQATGSYLGKREIAECVRAEMEIKQLKQTINNLKLIIRAKDARRKAEEEFQRSGKLPSDDPYRRD